MQAQEERDHAMLFYQYLQNENQKVELDAIAKPDKNAACHMDILKAGLDHEDGAFRFRSQEPVYAQSRAGRQSLHGPLAGTLIYHQK